MIMKIKHCFLIVVKLKIYFKMYTNGLNCLNSEVLDLKKCLQ